MAKSQKIYDRQIRTPLTSAMLDAVDAAREPGEDRTDFVRAALELLIRHRKLTPAKK